MVWLTVDPGDATGWALWEDKKLVSAGTTPLWSFADEVWSDLSGEPTIFRDDNYLRDDIEKAPEEPLTLVVCEDFKIYPWKAKDLAWDPVRTARLVGALTFMARVSGIELELQPASIKEQSVTAGAEELFYSPLHENRHQNDAIMHGIYRLLTSN